MGIYIKGMEMPKPKLAGMTTVCAAYVLVRPNGHAAIVVDNEDGLDSTEYPLVPVPSHGRLGDLDAAVEKLKKLREYHLDDSQSGVFIAAGISQCIDVLTGKDAPTIIPAEEDKP